MNPWNAVKDLFEENDGSLPDIFIENLTHGEMEDIYSWLLSFAEVCDNTVIYSIKEDKNVPIEYYNNPVRAFNVGEVEAFRHGLKEFIINNTVIPQLTLFIGQNEIEFDYRMGKEWGAEQVEALFEFLALIKDRAPSAQITQAYEGLYDKPNTIFTSVFEEYYKNR
jgi:hypothetical protein